MSSTSHNETFLVAEEEFSFDLDPVNSEETTETTGNEEEQEDIYDDFEEDEEEDNDEVNDIDKYEEEELYDEEYIDHQQQYQEDEDNEIFETETLEDKTTEFLHFITVNKPPNKTIPDILSHVSLFYAGAFDVAADPSYTDFIQRVYATATSLAKNNVKTLIASSIKDTNDALTIFLRDLAESVNLTYNNVFFKYEEEFPQALEDYRNGKKVSPKQLTGLVEYIDNVLKQVNNYTFPNIYNSIYNMIILNDPDVSAFEEEEDQSDYIDLIAEAIVKMFVARGYGTEKSLTPILIDKSKINHDRLIRLEDPKRIAPTLLVVAHLDKVNKATSATFGNILTAVKHEGNNYDQVVLISNLTPTSQTKRALNKDLYNADDQRVRWIYIPHSTVLARPIEHVYYSVHTKITQDEYDEIIDAYGDVSNLPKIKESDPVCLYKGYLSGDVVKISRNERREENKNILVEERSNGYKFVISDY